MGCTIVTKEQAQQLPKTQLQTREFQTRQFDTNNTKLIMKAVVNTLQDDGFVIKNAVVDLGLISATKEIDLASSSNTGSSDDFWSVFFNSKSKRSKSQKEITYNKLKIVEATVNVTEYGKNSKVRANFQAKILDNKGNTVEVFEVDDAKYYQDFFAKVDKGVFLQKQGF